MKNTIKLTFTFADGRVQTQVLDKPEGGPIRVAVPAGAKVDVQVLSPESDGAQGETAANAQTPASEHAIQFTKVGQDLVVEDAGEKLVELVDFYATPDVTMGSVWWDYAELLSQATSSEMVASEAMQVGASTAAGDTASVVEVGAPSALPAWLVGGLAAVELQGASGAVASSNVVSGMFVAGPVVTTHNLKVSLFDASGALLGGPTALRTDGSFSFNVGSYTGRVIAQLVDTASNNDYFDEATGAAVDLSTDLMAIGTVGSGTTTLNINVLSTMAAKQAGLVPANDSSTPPDLNNLVDALFDTANITVAGWFGLTGDVTTLDTTAVVDSSGVFNPNASDLGKVLAALSGVDTFNNQGIQATIDRYVTTGSSEPNKTASQIQADLIEGAKIVETANGSDWSQGAFFLGLAELVSASSSAAGYSVGKISGDDIVVAGNNEFSTHNTLVIKVPQGTLATNIEVWLPNATGTAKGSGTVALSAVGDQIIYTLTSQEITDLNALSNGFYAFEVRSTAASATVLTQRWISVDTFVDTVTFKAVTSDLNDAAPSDAVTNQTTGDVVFGYTGALASGHHFEYTTDKGVSWTPVPSAQIDAFTKTITISNLSLSASPEVGVRVVNSHNQPTTLVTQAITYDGIAPADIGVTLSDLSSGTVDPSRVDGVTNQASGDVVFAYANALSTGERLQYTMDGGTTWADVPAANITSSAITFSGVDFTVSPTIELRAVDAAGNTTLLTTQTITYDNTPPLDKGVTLQGVSSDAYDVNKTDAITNQTSGDVVFASTYPLWAGEKLQYTMDGGTTWADVPSSSINSSTNAITISAVDFTSNPTIALRAMDSAGNTTTLATQTITYDATAPADLGLTYQSVTSSPLDLNANDETTNNASADVVFGYTNPLATDDRLQYSVNNGATWVDVKASQITANTITLNSVNLQSSPTLQVRALDAAGNVTAQATQAFIYDGVAPADVGLTFTSVSSGADDANKTDAITNQASGDVVFSYSSAGLAADERFQFSTDLGTTWADVSTVGTVNTTAKTITFSSFSLSNSPTLKIRAVDAVGNTSKDFITQTITYDGTAPTGVTALSFASVSQSAMDTVDDTTTNQATGTVVFHYVGALESDERFQYSTDGNTWVDATAIDPSAKTITLSNLSLTGSPTLQVRAIDGAGNVATVTGSQTITYDGAAPTGITAMSFASVTSDANDTTADTVTNQAVGDVVLNYTGALGNGERFQYTIDSGNTWVDITAAQLDTSAHTITLGALSLLDSPTLQVRALDAAGNTTAALITTSIAYDGTAPTLPTISNLALSADSGKAGDFITGTSAQTITATFGAALNTEDTLWGSIDGGATWTDITSKLSGTSLSWDNVTLSTGTDHIQFKLRDAAGNEGSVFERAYTVDTTATNALTFIGLDPSNPNNVDANQVVQGSGAEAGAKVELFIGGTAVAQDIAYVKLGQSAKVNLDAYDSSIFGAMNGEVSYISPDTLQEDTAHGKQPYYRTLVLIKDAEFKSRNTENIQIRPGMTASVSIKARERSVFSYLTKPVTKTINQALGER